MVDDYDLKSLHNYAQSTFLLPDDVSLDEMEGQHREELKELFLNKIKENYQKREEQLGEVMEELERVVVLRTVDRKWMDHIAAMDDLRQGIGLRAFGQKDPLREYKFEAFNMFEAMVEGIQEDISRLIFRVEVSQKPTRQSVAVADSTPSHISTPSQLRKSKTNNQKPAKSDKVGRNKPCPCGSGKKI